LDVVGGGREVSRPPAKQDRWVDSSEKNVRLKEKPGEKKKKKKKKTRKTLSKSRKPEAMAEDGGAQGARKPRSSAHQCFPSKKNAWG